MYNEIYILFVTKYLFNNYLYRFNVFHILIQSTNIVIVKCKSLFLINIYLYSLLWNIFSINNMFVQKSYIYSISSWNICSIICIMGKFFFWYDGFHWLIKNAQKHIEEMHGGRGESCNMQERFHQAKMVTIILDQIGHWQNRCLAFSTFTFKQGQNTKSDQTDNCQCILYIFTMDLSLMPYSQSNLVMV